MTGSNPRGVLRTLLHDTRANVMVIVAIAVIPMTAMAGSAIDIARLYTVKARLQQACDAGALAGRRFMTGTKLDTNAKTQARKFFDNNFPAGWFLTNAVDFTASDTADGQVAGNAVATVPMTIMGKALFGAKPVALTATCEARLEITNADVMFVLDTTGSMACSASDSTTACSTYVGLNPAVQTSGIWAVPEKSDARIKDLRTAVVEFYKTLNQAVDTNARLRFGFVTYTSTVNVGGLLSSANLVSDWDYESRVANYTTAKHTPSTGSWSGWGTEQTFGSSISSSNCDKYGTNQSFSQGSSSFNPNPSGNPAPAVPTAVVTGGAKPGNVTSIEYRRKSWSGSGTGNGTCKREQRSATTTYSTRYAFTDWTYKQVNYDVSGFKGGSATIAPGTDGTVATSKSYNALELAAAVSGGTTTLVSWKGCIEERDTDAVTSFDSNDLPPDLDIDLPATSRETRWRPMWPEIIYDKDKDNPDAKTGYVSCGKPAQKLQVMTETQVSNYVNAADFKAIGGTYHDTGMIWGARLLSPTGLFASENATAPNGKPISRNIIFMTDGAMAPNIDIYGLYGYERYDKRVGGGSTDLEARHNARFAAVCEAAKNKNITIWVIAYAQTMTTTLKDCASPGKDFYAADKDDLKDAFENIAKQIADLRLSK